jgi:hypothetical protein
MFEYPKSCPFKIIGTCDQILHNRPYKKKKKQVVNSSYIHQASTGGKFLLFEFNFKRKTATKSMNDKSREDYQNENI